MNCCTAGATAQSRVLDPGQIRAHAALIRRCDGRTSVVEAQRVRALVSRDGYDQDRYLSNLLIQMLGRRGLVADAFAVFENIQDKNVFSWNSMVAAFAQNGHFDESLELFAAMPGRVAITWNILVAAYAQHGYGTASLEMYHLMLLEGVHPDFVTFVSVAGTCASLGTTGLKHGRRIHSLVLETGMLQASSAVGSSLINMYGKCCSIEEARLVFETMPRRDVVAWTAVVTAYAQNGHLQNARLIFDNMPQKNVISWTTMLTAYAQNGQVQEAREMFKCISRPDTVAWNALITAYTQNGDMATAYDTFEAMRERNVASWNAIISGYAQNGQGQQAVEVFRRMDMEGFQPNLLSFVSAIDACSMIDGLSLAQAKVMHAEVPDELLSNFAVGSALVHLYGICGSLQDAQAAFDATEGQNLVTWNALLLAYLRSENSKLEVEAARTFWDMNNHGVRPNNTTFMGIFTWCSHHGLVELARAYLLDMNTDYGLQIVLDHYVCIIDVLGRAGRLKEAEHVVLEMPFYPDEAAFTALLSASRSHGATAAAAGNAELGLLAGCVPQQSGPYVLLSSIYDGQC